MSNYYSSPYSSSSSFFSSSSSPAFASTYGSSSSSSSSSSLISSFSTLVPLPPRPPSSSSSSSSSNNAIHAPSSKYFKPPKPSFASILKQPPYDSLVETACKAQGVPALYPSQIESLGVAWANYHRKDGRTEIPMAICGDDMGNGKTLTGSLFMLMVMASKGEAPFKALVVCPSGILHSVWGEHMDKWKKQMPSLRIATYYGPKRNQHPTASECKAAHIVLTTYDVVLMEYTTRMEDMKASKARHMPFESPRDLFDVYESDWDVLIGDEIHKIRNGMKSKSKSGYSAAYALYALSDKCVNFRFMLTGTLLSNQKMEIKSYVRLGFPDTAQPFLTLKGDEVYSEYDEAYPYWAQDFKVWKTLSDARLREILASFYISHASVDFGVAKYTYTVLSVLTEDQTAKLEKLITAMKTIMDGVEEGDEEMKSTWMQHIFAIMGYMGKLCHASYMVSDETLKTVEEKHAMKDDSDLSSESESESEEDEKGSSDGESESSTSKESDSDGDSDSEEKEKEEKKKKNLKKPLVHKSSGNPSIKEKEKEKEKKRKKSEEDIEQEPEKKRGKAEPWVPLTLDQFLLYNSKIPALLDIVKRSLAQGDSVVIFCAWKKAANAFAQILRDQFPDQEPLVYNSDQTIKKRYETLKQFNKNDPKNSIIICGTKCGGEGISLTRANVVCLMDPWWNPSTERQALSRVYRKGQKKAVYVYRFLVDGAVIEFFMRLNQNKKARFVIPIATPHKDKSEYHLINRTVDPRFKTQVMMFLDETGGLLPRASYLSSCKVKTGQQYEFVRTDTLIPESLVQDTKAQAPPTKAYLHKRKYEDQAIEYSKTQAKPVSPSPVIISDSDSIDSMQDEEDPDLKRAIAQSLIQSGNYGMAKKMKILLPSSQHRTCVAHQLKFLDSCNRIQDACKKPPVCQKFIFVYDFLFKGYDYFRHNYFEPLAPWEEINLQKQGKHFVYTNLYALCKQERFREHEWLDVDKLLEDILLNNESLLH